MSTNRMLCLVGGQVLPNYIPVHEPATRPGALHGVFTAQSATVWGRIKAVVARRVPEIVVTETLLGDAGDMAGLRAVVNALLSDGRGAWALNATGGTKLMAAAAMDLFFRAGLKVYYVETARACTLQLNPDWSALTIPFQSALDVQTFFELHGKVCAVGAPITGQEHAVYEQLKRLDWLVWPSVRIQHGNMLLNEYDVIGLDRYRCFAFECKRLNGGKTKSDELVLNDLYKLFQVRQSFGGPFGKSYWVFSGEHKLRETDLQRLKDFDISLIPGEAISLIAKYPERFGLPPLKKKVAEASGG